MAHFRRKKRKKATKEIIGESPNASLAAMAPMIEQKGIFQAIHQQVLIPQKTLDYLPADKLVLVILSMLSGNSTISDVNWTLRIDKPLLMAFGYSSCPDQSVLQDTLNAATQENVEQLRRVATSLFAEHNLLSRQFHQLPELESVTIDFDLSAQPCSKRAEGAAKGYFAKRKNTYGRQLARVSVADTAEIVLDQLYRGNTVSCVAFKEMVHQMEGVLALDEKATRARIRLRLDGGFGTDENINFALSRGYHLLVKMYSGNRARKLCQSVSDWSGALTTGQQRSGESATREAAFIQTPHRYCRKTRQIGIRTPNAKNKCGYSYCVIVTTDLTSSLSEVLADYDLRSGMCESVFCQDNQGLAQRKRRKHLFCAQQMLMLLTQIAHNLIVWIKQWGIDAIALGQRCEEWVEQIKRKWQTDFQTTESIFNKSMALLAERGIKRFTHQLFALAGTLTIKNGKLVRIVLKAGYPMIDRIAIALTALLAETNVVIALGKT
ncbi:MAG: hypothetical protein CML07_08345 [Psychrobacter sp.]|jgi:hypothetical protein|nr:hypothetical protein [Psychrobacter sp.]